MRVLHLNLKSEYFDEIASGTKELEYRLRTPNWRKRLEGRVYDQIALAKGYPKKSDTSRKIYCEWNGYQILTIQHKHFGSDPVEVFAINVKGAK